MALRDDIREDLLENPRYKNGNAWRSAKEITSLLLERPLVDNPTPARQIPRPMTTDRLLELLDAHLSDASKQKVFALELSQLEPIAERARSGDIDGVTKWGKILVAKQLITAAELTAILTEYQTDTVANPTHPAQVLGDSYSQIRWGISTIPGLRELIAEVTSGN